MTLNYELRANGQIRISTRDGAHELRIEFDFEFRCWLTGSMRTSVDVPNVALESKSPHEPLADKAQQHSAPQGVEGQTSGPEQSQLPEILKSWSDHLCRSSRNTHAGRDDRYIAGAQNDCAMGSLAAEENSNEKQKTCVSSCLRLSGASADALHMLDRTRDELTEIERRVEDIASLLVDASSSDVCQMKAELSQIEAKAKQLETIGIDDIYTGDLRSGKQMAKDTKKDMLARFELVFAKLEACFCTIHAKLSENFSPTALG
jgi:hypothetical protein